MTTRRAAIEIHGAVQGVGFRPFVYRLATELGLPGWVLNDVNGVFIELDGTLDTIQVFLTRLREELPAVAVIDSVDVDWRPAAGFSEFTIRHSDGGGAKTAVILPDLATCDDCVAEVFDSADRRRSYPFTNCTNCGPRFSIIEELPYDRPNTTMSGFEMCHECSGEYEDPADRRFHAQPNACAVCGPSVTWTAGEVVLTEPDEALDAAAAAIRAGETVALKGIGGYQLLVDARNETAVRSLRDAKARPAKPFAVMVSDLTGAAACVEVDETAANLLSSPPSPIVILPKVHEADLSALVAPDNPTIGVMLPTTPLHHLLLAKLDGPVVATSGNLTDEPIAISNAEARNRLGEIASGFLAHNRPIRRHVDDSVAWIVEASPRLLRRARGYAPMPVTLSEELPTVLATGAHLKNTVAVSVGRNVFISQHIGDLETDEAHRAFTEVIADLSRMYEIEPDVIAHDLHPDYLSTRFALATSGYDDIPKLAVQHHHAHLASCLADNATNEPALGVTWDGTGYGPDGTIWGGEFLLGDARSFRRVAHLRPFRLPGGEAAVREPRRCAAGVLAELDVDLTPEIPGLESFTENEVALIESMLAKDINSPTTTSAGRLFDAAAAIAGLASVSSFEGHGAMALEYIASDASSTPYPMKVIRTEGPLVLDWEPMIRAMLADVEAGTATATIARRFHEGLIQGIVAVARLVGHHRIALTGGCFQNRILTERTASELRLDGFDVLLHSRVPPNDGGISLGQVVVAAATTSQATAEA
ncbi:MAG: carbamoyltransferase HypF [Acidimicrobiia bacterium]